MQISSPWVRSCLPLVPGSLASTAASQSAQIPKDSSDHASSTVLHLRYRRYTVPSLQLQERITTRPVWARYIYHIHSVPGCSLYQRHLDFRCLVSIMSIKSYCLITRTSASYHFVSDFLNQAEVFASLPHLRRGSMYISCHRFD